MIGGSSLSSLASPNSSTSSNTSSWSHVGQSVSLRTCKHAHQAQFSYNPYMCTCPRAGGQTPTSVTWLWVEKKTRAKGSERPLLSAANRLRAWYMCALSWNTCFTVGHTRHITLSPLFAIQRQKLGYKVGAIDSSKMSPRPLSGFVSIFGL